jgi:hypothetical protein
MSLINDALKRVKAAQQQAAPSASVGPQLKPVEPPAPAVRQGVNLLLPGALAVVALLGLLLVWFVRNKTPSVADTPVRAQMTSAAVPVVSATASSTPVSPTRPVSTSRDSAAPSRAPVEEATRRPAAEAQKVSETTNNSGAAQGGSIESKPGGSQVALASSETNASSLSNGSSTAITATNAIAQTEAPKLAPLKLQGITYDRRRPSAVISGRTVFVGDRLRDMRVVSIQADSATLVGQGRTNVLSLAE